MISHDVHVTQEKGRRAAGLALLKPVAEVASLAAAILLALVALGAYRYGSVPAALAAARGRGLAVDAATKSVGLVEEGEQVTTDFTLTNVTTRPIRIVGSTSSCSCAVPGGEIPFEIPPGSSRPFQVLVVPQASPAQFLRSVGLYTDFPGQNELVLNVKGEVRTKTAARGQRL